MADIANARPIARYGDPNALFPAIYGPIGIAANLLIYGGGMAGTDAAGNMVKASAAACTNVAGVARKNYYNRTTDPSGGAAGAVQGEIVAGVFPFFISTDGGAITNASRWQDVYVVDDQTISLAPQAGTVARLPAGYLLFVDNLGGPTNGMAWVQVGESNPVAAPKHLAVALPLASLQAQTSGVAFTIITLPANFWLSSAQIRTTQTFAGGGVTTVVTSLSGGADANGSIVAAGASQPTLGNVNGVPGSNPYQQRGGQAIKILITEGGGTLATLTAGALTVDLIGTIVI